MPRRLLLPGVVLIVLVGGISLVFLTQREDRAPTAPARGGGGPLVQLGAMLRGLPDTADSEGRARQFVEATLESGRGSPRLPILEALRCQDVGGQWAGLLAVPRYGPPDRELADALQALLGSESDRVRRTAAEAAAFLGADFERLRPLLLETARDPVASVRSAALGTLAQRFDKETAATVWPAFAVALEDPDRRARAAAAKGLSRFELGEVLAPADIDRIRPQLVEAMRDEHADVRMYAVMALGRAGPRAAPDAEAILALLADENSLVRGTAANALGFIGPDVLGPVERALASSEGARAASLLWTLRLIGKPALPALERACKHPRASIRVQAALKLWELDQPAEEAVQRLVAALDGGDPDAIRLAARGLGRIGTAGASARSALERHADHEDEAIRAAVATALRRIGAAQPKGG